MDFMENYKTWLNNKNLEKDLKDELLDIKDNAKEIEERFYKNLEFGTGGLRGIIGAGSNRMNTYTVRMATQGLATYICKQGDDAKQRGVVIAYDSRYKSSKFAMEAAKVLAANQVQAFVFSELAPTPELSFAVRHLGAIAGIVITASHNPKEYNGYKAYWEDGGQLPPESADVVLAEIDKLDIFNDVKIMEKQQALELGLIKMIGDEVHTQYLSKVKEQSINLDVIPKVADNFKIIYTPFHGAGNKPVRKILEMIGLKHVLVVKEQAMPDYNFPTVKSPNPEEKEGFTLAIEMAQANNVDLIIGTDPDGDRVGLIVRDSNGEYIALTGNQTGALLTEYILSQTKLPDGAVVIKTIVTTELVNAIAQNYGVEIMEVLTGFKFIGEKIKEFEQNPDMNRHYIFGFEESYGYLKGTYARDKDAVVASMLIAEMGAWYKSRSMSLYDGLQEIYNKYGVYKEAVKSIGFSGKEGVEKMKSMMQQLRENPLKCIDGINVTAIRDYQTQVREDFINNTKQNIELPKSNVLYFEMEDKSWFAIRPSGTEPKIKIYFGVVDSSDVSAANKVNRLMNAVVAEIGQ